MPVQMLFMSTKTVLVMDCPHQILVFLIVLKFLQIAKTSEIMKQQGLFQFGNIVKVSEGNILQKSESFLSKVTTKNEVECWVNCVLNERCFSLNVVFLNQTFLQCELFNWTGINWNASLAPKKNGYYAQIQDHCQSCLNGGTCVESSADYKCACLFGYKGNRCEIRVNQDCSTLQAAGYHENAVYSIDPDGKGEFPVLCDMKTDGGGWVVIQKRFDASISFDRIWNEYKKGFGVMKTGEFWLGNDFIHRLTAAKPTQVYIELEDTSGRRTFAKYSTFIVESEVNLYRLDVSGYSGTAGNALVHPTSVASRSKGMGFATKYRDSNKCSGTWGGGWWYNNCAAGALNKRTITWTTQSGIVKKTSMKVKPSSK